MNYLALDLGAGSGRAIVGYIREEKIYLDEILRFENKPVCLGGVVYWNFLSLFNHIKEGIAKAHKEGYVLKGIGIDTWGVDFGLLDSSGKLIANPVTYRDRRTEGMCEEVFFSISAEDIYQASGIQIMEINTLFQLVSQRKNEDPSLSIAETLLFTPDLINYFLTGVKVNEYTIASTSQFLNAVTKNWELDFLQKLNIPTHFLNKIVFPGEVIGNLSAEIVAETGAGKARLFAVGSHDTASAIGAIPGEGQNWAFLSSGTWSLLGVLNDHPILTSEALENQFTNEGGINNKILFMRNITGLWLLQRLIGEWEKEEGYQLSYTTLLAEAEKAEPFRSIVDSDDPLFANPANMNVALQQYCKKTNQFCPETKGQLVRCVLESLAVKYYFVMQKLQKCSGKKIDKLYVVGGGSQNALLNQFIADSLGIEVVVGLTEATALGNIMQQAIADDYIPDWGAAHKIIKNSFNFTTYSPCSSKNWKDVINDNEHLFMK